MSAASKCNTDFHYTPADLEPTGDEQLKLARLLELRAVVASLRSTHDEELLSDALSARASIEPR